jgi:DNA-binding beta-propeller fold protein YncE
MVVSGRQAWLAQNHERLVVRVDLHQRRVVERIGLPIRPDALAVGNEVWAAAAGDAELGRVANAAITRVREGVNARPAVYYVPGSGGGTAVIAADAATLWVGNDGDDRIARIDTARRRVSATVRTVTPRVLVIGRDVVWAVEALDDVVTRIDPTSGSIIGSVGVELHAPSAGLEAAGALWITDRASGLLWRIDAAGHVATRTIEVGRGPIAIAYGGGYLWVANVLDETISKIDPSDNEVVATQGVDGHPIALGWSGGLLWVLTRTTVS